MTSPLLNVIGFLKSSSTQNTKCTITGIVIPMESCRWVRMACSRTSSFKGQMR
ncbi:hypothetical protein C1H46_045892 [Malus baccata]|uniref:Uncharacterized protein n=1 Tax=Malus baccata TaxID=106549 RepID=A0A540K2R8_MALBA|nr:hypothetical protein C1H46_045892 [Malus baccata]